MIEAWLAAIKRHTGAQDAQAPGPRWMTVTSVDPTRPAVKGILQPEGVPSGWFPVAQPAAGSGVTVLAPIAEGTQALLVPELGTPGHDYAVVGFSHSDAAQIPPAANAPGLLGVPNATTTPWAASEFMIVANGAVIRVCANGSVYIRGNVGIDGNLFVNGAISAAEGITAGAGGPDRVGLQTHTHDQPADSHGDSEATTTAPNANS